MKYMTKMSQWIRHGIIEEYKEYGVIEGESTLYVQDMSLNKLNKNMVSRVVINVKSLITQLVRLLPLSVLNEKKFRV